ncbi:MAG TPA: HAD family hydrolase [Bryobacteraceae bacterium]
MKRAVFLDRDGVINEPVVRAGRPYPPACADEVILVPDAAGSLTRLKQESFLLIVVTNQPDVARGTTTRENVEKINQILSSQLPLDDFLVCYHDDSDDCACRKPKPGLLLEAAAKHEIDLAASFFIGDRWRDIEAGVAARCRTILIDRCYNERSANALPEKCVQSLSEAAEWILSQGK